MFFRAAASLAGDEQVHTPAENEYFSQRWTSEPWTCCCLWSLHTQAEGEGKSLSCVFKKGARRIKGRSLRRHLWMSGGWALFCADPSPLFKGVWCVCGCSCVSLCGRGSTAQSYFLHIFLHPDLAWFISTGNKMVHKSIKDLALTLMF